MRIRNIKDTLSQHPFFEGLSTDFIELLSGCATNQRFNRGHFIFNEGGTADHFYLINRGRVALEFPVGSRGPVAIDHLGQGQILGWSWFLPPYRWQFAALAIDTTTAISFDARCVRSKCEADSALGYELMKRINSIVTSRLMTATRKLAELA